MIFQHTWEKVLSGEKTQTRRIVKPGDGFTTPLAMEVIGRNPGRVIHTVPSYHNPGANFKNIYSVMNGKRIVYEVGNTYAVQPGRTQKAVARIRILDIRREDVRSISWEDTQSEGFTNKVMFFNTWLQMHDPSIYEIFRDYKLPYDGIKTASELIDSRPANRYDAWALTFELVA